MSNSKFPFFCSCVDWNIDDVDNQGGLVELIDNRVEIQRPSFLKKVERRDLMRLEENLGYDNDMKMANDPYVTYFKSKHHEEVVYGFVQSAIEYVFEAPVR